MSSPSLGLYLSKTKSNDGSRHSTSPGPAKSLQDSPPTHREPIRSFIQENVNVRESTAPVDTTYLAQSVRKDTADIASYALSHKQRKLSPSLLPRPRSGSPQVSEASTTEQHGEHSGASAQNEQSFRRSSFSQIAPAFQSYGSRAGDAHEGPSMLATLLRDSSPDPHRGRVMGASHDVDDVASGSSSEEDAGDAEEEDGLDGARLARESSRLETVPELDEQTPLLSQVGSKQGSIRPRWGSSRDGDLEAQRWEPSRIQRLGHHVKYSAAKYSAILSSPSKWDKRAIWTSAVVAPVSYLPAVLVGLLLNILDALSYGMILFPLANPIFSHLGSAGISIFYVSTITSQLVFSSGSIFRAGIGSELIEVVPFFHNMAETITLRVGKENPDAVIATTIVSYAMSSLLTGTVFYLMGKFKFGFMVGFIPRHILIGCIGGVGFFLVVTGFEVSARIDGGIEYNMETLRLLIRPETLPLWITPLAMAVVLFYGQSKIRSKYFLPLFIIAIPALFYLCILALNNVEVDDMRDDGWIFEGPPSGEPWWYFYTLYKFHLVRWDALAETIPAMFALTFFGILHVPINVPALALNTGEDNADLDQELKLHGYSNFISGLLGSIQNYLVYSNTMFFMKAGGDSRLAGVMLAGFTALVMTIGPSIIGFIPVMMVGTLIFDLGFELLYEAVWLPRKKLKIGEYLTVIVIVLIMGVYDFVVGIGVGILLAFVTLVVQTSRVPAVRAAYSGETVTSTVRRNHSHSHYLHQVGRQIFIVKLTGYLFFGTIVSVEERIRNLIGDMAFTERPIRFLVIDLWHVTGVDYSAGEAFNRMSRILDKKGIVLILSGVEGEGQLSRTLRAVGVGRDGIEVMLLPDLNSALESCENELLKTYYASQAVLADTPPARTPSLEVPRSGPSFAEMPTGSPRGAQLREAAQRALTDAEIVRPAKWQSFGEPLRLMLQVFQGLSDKNEDFWFRATPYFTRQAYPVGEVLFRMGEEARGFYLVEKGVLRAEYDLPQGWLCESIVAGTTCGELPFFSETPRTATVTVERDCTVWFLGAEGWAKMQAEERDVAWELLRVSLKLTSEHMGLVTSYVLSIAG
ncbi:related to sulfate transporter [Cephalotrichum gorgonifer]|uniref:Related to sulfate transporter n=1 Tax=Cephalotrichum gorgonifer TaxID=2041049 RepID=A0AAE8MPE3_9PEZI|nr:related to sulfate transporter [Cephalotrichum gorgonifer]